MDNVSNTAMVLAVVGDYFGMAVDEIPLTSTLEELGADSLDVYAIAQDLDDVSGKRFSKRSAVYLLTTPLQELVS